MSNYKEERKNVWNIGKRFGFDMTNHIEKSFSESYTEEIKNSFTKSATLRSEIIQTMREFGINQSETLNQIDYDSLVKISEEYYKVEFQDKEKIDYILSDFKDYDTKPEIKKSVIASMGIWELANDYDISFSKDDVEKILKRYYQGYTECSEETIKTVKDKMLEVMQVLGIKESTVFNQLEKDCIRHLCTNLCNSDEETCNNLRETITNYDAREENKKEFLNAIQKRIEEIWAKEDGEIFDNIYLNTDIHNEEEVNKSIQFIQEKARTSSTEIYLSALRGCNETNITNAITYQLKSTKVIFIAGISLIVLGIVLAFIQIPLGLISIPGIVLLIRHLKLRKSWKLLSINGSKIHKSIDLSEKVDLKSERLHNILFLVSMIICELIIVPITLLTTNDSPGNSVQNNYNKKFQSEVTVNYVTEGTEFTTYSSTESSIAPITSTVETQKSTPTSLTLKDEETIIDIDDSAKVSVNTDGSFNVEFTEAPCSLTLPASWKNKFVIRQGTIMAKTAYKNGNSGKLFSVVFKDEYVEVEGIFIYLGKADSKYCYYVRVTDARYDIYNTAESEEYESMMNDLNDIIKSVICIPSDSENDKEESTSLTNLSPYLYGQISSNGKEIEGYTSSYIIDGGEKSRQWICEDTWHITARRTINSYGIQWYECWDTDDGDYYGWIDEAFLLFYSSDNSSSNISSYVGSWSEVSGVRVWIEITEINNQTVKVIITGSGGASISYKSNLNGTLNPDGSLSIAGESYTEIFEEGGISHIEDYNDNYTGVMRIGRTGLLTLSIDGTDEFIDEVFKKD